MNKDKIIKDLKERNDKLKNQYELLEIRTNNLEQQVKNQKEIIKKQTEKIIPENHELHNRISKATGYITHEWFKREQIGISHLSFSYDELQHILDILRGKNNEDR